MPSMRLDRTSEDNGCLHQLVLPALSWESLQMPVTPLPDATFQRLSPVPSPKHFPLLCLPSAPAVRAQLERRQAMLAVAMYHGSPWGSTKRNASLGKALIPAETKAPPGRGTTGWGGDGLPGGKSSSWGQTIRE